MKKPPDKPLTCDKLKDLLKLSDIEFSNKLKVEDLRLLCQKHNLIEPEFKDVEKICIVKCALRRSLNLDNDKFIIFRDEIDKIVNITSRMLRRTSLTLAFHILWLLENKKPIPDLYKEKDTYWKNWLKIGIDNVYPDANSRLSFDKIKDIIDKVIFPDSLDESIYVKEYPKYFDQIINYTGHTLKTMVKNNTWVPLFNRLSRLTKYKLKQFNILNISTYTVMKVIRAEKQEMDDWPEILKDYVNDVRKRLKAEYGTILYDNYGEEEVSFETMLYFNYWMQQEFERLEKRRIKIMPIFNVGRAHIRLDIRTLLFMFKNLKDKKPEKLSKKDCTKEEWEKYLEILEEYKNYIENDPFKILIKEEIRDPDIDMNIKLKDKKPEKLLKKNCKSDKEWIDYKVKEQEYKNLLNNFKETEDYKITKLKYNKFLNLQKEVIGSFFNKNVNKKTGWSFNCSILTDGVSVSLQYSKTITVKTEYKKLKAKIETDDFEKIDYDRNLSTKVNDTIVLGLDPGRNNLAYVTYFIDSKNKKSWSLTRGAYYVDSGIQKLNKKKTKAFKTLTIKWNELGGENIGLTTSKTLNIEAYILKYSKFSDEWWTLALKRKESRDNLQRYIGKRHVMDSFYSKIKKYMKEKEPGMKINIAYGLAVKSMKATGKGEISAPIGPMFESCKRIFKNDVIVVDEFRTTVMNWKTGTCKEKVYKKFKENIYEDNDDFRLHKEILCHTSDKKTPIVPLNEECIINTYIEYKKTQSKHRKGGHGVSHDMVGHDLQGENKINKIRYPEVRGLRFCPEDGMYLDRDQESALSIARLYCMELLGKKRPYPFDRRHTIES